MSDAEKRQSRQRALTIGACAAVFAFGGPLVAQRFGHQKEQEAFRADAITIAQSISTTGEAAATRLVSFTNKADPEALVHQASYVADAPGGDLLGGVSLRARDMKALRGLITFDLDGVDADAPSEDEELQCLSEAVYYEARSEDEIGQMAVAEVVMNRVRDSRFPKSVCEVVYQGQYRDTGCQFTFTCDGSTRHKPFGEAWDRARDIALHVALGLNKPVTNKATHYHTDYVNPYWKAGMVETAVHGTHIFYRFPKTSSEWTTARIALEAQDARERDAIIAAEGEVPPPAEVPVAATLITVAAPAAVLPDVAPAIAPAL